MNDLDILKQIEKELKIKLTKKDNRENYHNGYFLNGSNKIVALSLFRCEINSLDRIISELNDFQKLTKLDLGYNLLTDISPLKKLQQLTKLELGNNQLTDITPLKKLQQLTELNLSSNQLTDITPLKELQQLTELNLSYNQLTDITPLKELQQLTELNLSANQLTDISPLKELQQLTELDLFNNKLKDITPLKDLHQLIGLNVGINQLTSIFPLEKLKHLKLLWLVKNNIRNPSVLSSLTQLERLSLGSNQISSISFLKELKNLVILHLQDNLLKNISPLKNLTNLTELSLDNNKISDISAIKYLKGLRNLRLQKNPITNLPLWITDFNLDIDWRDYGGSDGFITFYENPLKSPPVEIIKQGKNAIKRYFEKIEEEGVDFIYEAKLTLVGEGSAGKTSLQRRLLNKRAALPRKDKRTRGIEIKDWQFKKEKDKIHLAHIWDFGGQDVYYPVHRFFLTENSVFVLLASTRQTHHNFDYWIPTIYQFGGKSPIILGQTCHEGNKVSWNDLGVYVGNPNFNIIKTQSIPYYDINLLNNNEGLEKIRETIVSQITNLPHYGKGVPKSWIPVRNVLAKESKIAACISFEKFQEICTTSNPESFAKLTDIKDCCQFLHDIGVVLWYSKNEELKNWVILQPEWAMNAVYKIIDDGEIQKRRGNILYNDFIRLWKDVSYEDKHPTLKKMLEIFKIAFPKKHKQLEYIIPARLLSMPNSKKWPDIEPCLRLEYKYEFMPRGMVNQVSAELSRYIVSDKEVWNNAVNFTLEDSEAYCQVEEDFYNRKIIIRAKGQDARGLCILVMDALKNITEGYKGVKPEIYAPCTCSTCKTGNKPTTFLYDNLLKWSAKRNNATVTCNESNESLRIEELLRNVGLPNPETNRRKQTKNKTIKIFLASSSELKDDREKFEIFINRENKQLNNEGVFLKLELWEDFIDAMSQTRLQDEYNNTAKNCDIFVSLFFTKVGKFTTEEFDSAFRKFKESGKPLVYTYFKDEQVNMSKIKEAEIQSKFAFEKKLKSLEHFPTLYKNIGDLKYEFKMQLDKVLPNL